MNAFNVSSKINVLSRTYLQEDIFNSSLLYLMFIDFNTRQAS